MNPLIFNAQRSTLNAQRSTRTHCGAGGTAPSRCPPTATVATGTAGAAVTAHGPLPTVSRPPSPASRFTFHVSRFMQPASRFTFHVSRSAGFTLVEMLTVIAIIAILIGVTGLSLVKARELARRARADAELREMVAAWLQYQQLYEEWPSAVKGKIGIDVDDTVLDPLVNPESSDNSRGLVLLNVTLPKGGSFNDPWGTPYRLSFDSDTERKASVTALRTSVTFPNRQRRFP